MKKLRLTSNQEFILAKMLMNEGTFSLNWSHYRRTVRSLVSKGLVNRGINCDYKLSLEGTCIASKIKPETYGLQMFQNEIDYKKINGKYEALFI